MQQELKANGAFGPGTFLGPNTVVSAGTSGYTLSSNLNADTVMSDPTTDITLTVERYDPNLNQWVVDSMARYQGDLVPPAKGYRASSISTSCDFQEDTTFRASFSTINRINFGLTWETP